MKRMLLLALAIVPGIFAPAYARTNSVPAEVRDQKYLFEVIRHLYRWYLDEHDIEAAVPARLLNVWLREATPGDLDPEDQSRMAELGIPLFRLRVMLKKTNYRIPELDLHIQSQNYKIIDVCRDPPGAPAPDGAWQTAISVQEMKDYLFRTRAQPDPFTPALAGHLREAVMRQIALDKIGRHAEIHEVHIAPLSPVANELWIFWETGRRLIRVASDIELTDPAMWAHERLAVRVFDIDRQTVVALAEVPGSNAYLTRDQVGRALFNCIVLGEYREINTGKGAPTPP